MRRAALAVKLILWLAVLAGCIVAGVAALRFVAPSVKVTRLVEGPVVRAVYATGTISPEREYAIRATNAGTLDVVSVDKGSNVTAGQPLATLAEPALTYEVARSRAELVEKRARADEKTSPVLADLDARLAAANEQLGIAQREEARQRQTLERGGGSVTDVDRAADRTQTVLSLVSSLREQREMRKLELAREASVAAAAVEAAESNLGRQTLTSPIDGTVLDRPISQGTRVAVNDVVMRVADVRPDRLVMRAAVDEEDITRVTVGQKVLMTLYAFEGRPFVGRVKTIYAEADAARRTFEVDVAVDAPDARFQPGMTGELAFVLDERERAKILPSAAVQGDVVYALRDGRVVALDAKLGVRAVDRVEVLDGVSSDERVIVSNVTPGMVGGRARATEIDPRVAAGIGKVDKEQASNAAKAFHP
ncbi:efflux RND transporter periplasmic adaptor subunit [bacterium]|nr:MAG: efflux RND transporter periplasmic adaptor subunit [bacterium]